nr:MAG TPA: hypothetical protein [Caudoviricetes sp.]
MELKDFVFFKVHVPSLYYVTVAERVKLIKYKRSVSVRPRNG